MYFPKLHGLKQKVVTLSRFSGLDQTGSPVLGDCSGMENLTSDGFPALQPRQGRRVFAQTGCDGLLAKDEICYVNQRKLYIGTYPMEMGLTQGEKQLVAMGPYVVIFPDKKFVNTQDPQDRGNLDVWFTAPQVLQAALCQADGRPFPSLTVGE